MRRFAKILLGVVIALAIGVGALLWRLDSGPISLTPIQPLLQTLIDRGSPYRVTFADPELVWARQAGVIALSVRDFEAYTPEGALVASAPLLRGTLAVAPLLLQRRIEPVDVQVDLPKIELKRDRDRRLVLYFDERLGGLTLGEAAGGGGLEALLGEAGEVNDPRLASLRLVRVRAPALEFLDEVTNDRATATDAVFELEREANVWTALLKGDVGGGSVEVQSEPTTTPARPDVTVTLRDVRPKDYAAFAPDVPLAGLDLPVSGTVRFPFDAVGGELGAAEIDVTLGAGAIAVTNLGLPPVPVERGLLRASMAAGWRSATIERLELASEAFTLGLSGTAGLEDGELVADIVADAEALDVGDVLRVWPTEVAATARDWIAANIAAGQLKAVTLQVQNHSSRPDQPELGGSFTFEGARVRYLDTMPAAEGVAGTASIAGNSLQVKLSAGRTGGVDVTRGTVTLSNLIGAATTQLKAQADLRSSVPAAMRLLDAEPVALRRNTGLDADRASGNQATSLQLSLPLLDQIPPARIRYKATTQLSDVELREVSPGYTAAAKSFGLVAEPAGISANGQARVNGVPLKVDFRENTPPVKGVARTVKVAGELGAADARALRFEWPADVGGVVGVDASLVEARSPRRTVDATLDLRHATLDIPELLIAKRRGEAGTASARLVQPDDKTLRVERATVEVAGWRAEGDAGLQLDPVRPERVALRQLRGPLGDLTAELDLEGSRWRGRIDIGRLDLRPVIQRGGAPGAGGDGAAPALPDFLLQVTARQLRLGDAPFSNLAGTVERRRGIWQSAKLQGSIEDSSVSLDMDTVRQTTAAILRGSDAGWLIRGFASTDNGVRGGTFRLSAALDQSAASLGGSGDLKIRNFTLWGAPTIARIISLASFSGLSNALSGRGVPVERLIVPFNLRDQVLTINEARMVGSDIGARAEGTVNFASDQLDVSGTVAPAYTVNRIIGRIPLIGQIMSGSRSDAALAATFRVTGSVGQPQVSVNPLAALVPGMIRDLFGAFTADAADSGRTDER